jgi:AbrB family looped-hinge helix DNA binding protein
MRITSKGQVTIPQEIREQFGFLPDTEVEFVAKKNSVQIVKATNPRRPTRGDALVRRLRGAAGAGLSTDEILALTRK